MNAAALQEGEVPAELVGLGVVGGVARYHGEVDAGQVVDGAHHRLDDLGCEQLLRPVGADLGQCLQQGRVRVGPAVEELDPRRGLGVADVQV